MPTELNVFIAPSQPQIKFDSETDDIASEVITLLNKTGRLGGGWI